MQPSDDELPFRLRHSTFCLYEPTIAKAIVEYPESVSINPAPLRPTTYAARLRDAIVSFRKYQWSTASFTLEELDVAQLTVRHSDLTVIIGPKQPRGRHPGEATGIINPNHAKLNGLPVDRIIDAAELAAICCLLSGKLLPGPVILRAQILNAVEISNMEENYDIAITQNDKNYTIIL